MYFFYILALPRLSLYIRRLASLFSMATLLSCRGGGERCESDGTSAPPVSASDAAAAAAAAVAENNIIVKETIGIGREERRREQ